MTVLWLLWPYDGREGQSRAVVMKWGCFQWGYWSSTLNQHELAWSKNIKDMRLCMALKQEFGLRSNNKKNSSERALSLWATSRNGAHPLFSSVLLPISEPTSKSAAVDGNSGWLCKIRRSAEIYCSKHVPSSTTLLTIPSREQGMVSLAAPIFFVADKIQTMSHKACGLRHQMSWRNWHNMAHKATVLESPVAFLLMDVWYWSTPSQHPVKSMSNYVNAPSPQERID